MQTLFSFKGKKIQPTTIKAYVREISLFEGWLGDRRLVDATVRDYENFVAEKGWSRVTARRNHQAVRARLKVLTPQHDLIGYKLPPEEETEPADDLRTLQVWQLEELKKVVRELPNPYMRIRNEAMLDTKWETFVRDHELASIQLKHVDLREETIKVLAKAKAGNGKRWQEKVLWGDASESFKAGLEVRPLVASPDCKTLFCNQYGEPLTTQGVYELFKRLSRKVEFDVSGHDFRRGGACYACESGVPYRLVMAQGGWESYDVFMKYTKKASLKAF